jgi:phage-related protein
VAGNQVVLTFVGDDSDLSKTFDNVGSGAERTSRAADGTSDSFDRVGRAADEVDTKAMGFRDTMTGVQDTAAGTAMIMKGNLFEGFLTLGMGIGDLGSAFYNFLIPAMKSSVTWLKATRVGTIATTVAGKAAAIGAKAWAGAQWLLNAAMTANPIGLVVLAIVALIAIFVLAWNKSDTFRRIVTGAFNGVLAAGRAVGSWFKGTFAPWFSSVISSVIGWFRAMPGRIRSALSSVASAVTAPFRGAFNGVARAWNNTVGRLSWSVPGWVPGIGGNSISAPRLPTFDVGGRVPGVPGEHLLAIVQAGERVTPIGGGGAAGGSSPLIIRSDGSRLADAVVDLLEVAVRARGLSIGAART